MYDDRYSDEIVKKLKSLNKKDPPHYRRLRKKMDEILCRPHHSYKLLHHDMKGISRVHIGHFVLVFIIDHTTKTVSFEDYDHHDNVYKTR